MGKIKFLKKQSKKIPIELKNKLRALAGKTVKENLTISKKQKEYVILKLRDDFEKLRDEYGVKIDRWGF